MERLLCSTQYGEIYILENNIKRIKKVYKNFNDFKLTEKYCSFFDNRYLAKIFQINEDKMSVLMEFVEGSELNSIQSFEKRVNLAAEFYRSWITSLKRIDKIEEYHDINYLIRLQHVKEVVQEDIIQKLKIKFLFVIYKNELEKYVSGNYIQNQYLLHGDIHGKNIIINKDNTMKLIDLSPVVGEIEFEYTKFIENELYNCFSFDEFSKKANYMIKQFGLVREKFLKILYIDSCFRMLDTVFNDNQVEDITKMKLINKRILRMVGYNVELC